MTASTETPGLEPAREMTRMEQWRAQIGYWLARQRRRLPYLVWRGDELDVVVTFREGKLPQAEAMDIAGLGDFADRVLNRGALPEIERKLDEIGIGFDKGAGCHGRDWEWDWSLSGPISVRFKARATKPERRT